MRFQQKAALQQMLSHLPGGERLNYWLQRHVTRVYPRTNSGFENKVRRGAQHLARYRRQAPGADWSTSRLLEIGAGWDFIVPLTYAMCGIEHQCLVDHVSHFRAELVNDTLQRLEAFRPMLEAELGCVTRSLGGPVRERQELRERLGIQLLAPADARETGLPAESIDLITNTSTMEHLFAEHIPAILAEWHRILAPAGVLSCHIDLKDHYFDADPSISCYNFLRFTADEWQKFNPLIHHQNRLRYPQFVQLFEEAGWRIVEVELDLPTESDRQALAQIPLDAEFQGYTEEELGAKIVWIVARQAV